MHTNCSGHKIATLYDLEECSWRNINRKFSATTTTTAAAKTTVATTTNEGKANS